MEPSIYEYPDIFRRAHLESPGEIPAEVVFLQQVWNRHRKSPTRRILDIACGDSPHGRLLAGDGFEVVGIDRSPTMIAAGRRKAGECESSLLPPADRKVHSPRARIRCRDLHVRNISGDRRERRTCSRISNPSAVRSSAAACTASTSTARIRFRASGSARCGASARRAPAASHSEIREFHRPIAWHSPLHSIYELECTINFPGRRCHNSRFDSGALHDSRRRWNSRRWRPGCSKWSPRTATCHSPSRSTNAATDGRECCAACEFRRRRGDRSSRAPRHASRRRSEEYESSPARRWARDA